MRRFKKRDRPRAVPAETNWLTREEDDELRRLNYFSQFGALAGQTLERFRELRLRDRRKTVRTPREFGLPEKATPDTKAEEVSAPRPHPNLWFRSPTKQPSTAPRAQGGQAS